MSSSRLAPVHEMKCTLSRRIISASESPTSAVLMAPASVTSIWPPPSRWRVHPSAASTSAAALKCRKWCFTNCETGPSSVDMACGALVGVGGEKGNRRTSRLAGRAPNALCRGIPHGGLPRPPSEFPRSARLSRWAERPTLLLVGTSTPYYLTRSHDDAPGDDARDLRPRRCYQDDCQPPRLSE